MAPRDCLVSGTEGTKSDSKADRPHSPKQRGWRQSRPRSGQRFPGRRHRAIRGWGNRVSRRSETIGRIAGTRAPRFAVTDTNSPDASIARVQLDHRSLGRTGHFGSAPLISAENVFPPIPSELIMPLDGFTVARDDFDTVGAVSVGSGGSVSGSMLWLSPMDGSARVICCRNTVSAECRSAESCIEWCHR